MSPYKEDGTTQGSRLSLSMNRTSPIGVPIPNNTRRIRQRNDSTSSGDSWQLVTGTGSLCGTTSANAAYMDSVLIPSLDCKPCAACITPRTLQGNVNTNDEEIASHPVQ